MNRKDYQNYRPGMPIGDGIEDSRRAEFVQRLIAMGEHYAAGFFAEADASMHRRYALAFRNMTAHMDTPEWRGDALAPIVYGRWGERYAKMQAVPITQRACVPFHYTEPWWFDWGLFYEKVKQLDAADADVLTAVANFTREHIVPAGGWTHCTVNYGRVIQEGLNGYRRRIRQAARNADAEQHELYDALDIVIDAVGTMHTKWVDAIRTAAIDASAEDTRIRLLTALERVPFEPARNFYEAFISTNFIFHLDGCDSPGRMDQYLYEHYRRDRDAGVINDAMVVDLLHQFWLNMDRAEAWNVAIGGDGCVNELTYLMLESARGLRRPNLALRVPADADDKLWDAAFHAISGGSGTPALYNDAMYVKAVRDYRVGVREDDLKQISYGGCTETMIQGCSNVGSCAATLHLLQTLERAMNRWLDHATSFEEFLAKFFAAVDEDVEAVCDGINLNSMSKAKVHPQLVRTLLVDDCIERGIDFGNGGARYNWEIIALEGFSNVVDSLYSIKTIVFDRGEMTGEMLRVALGANFDGFEGLLATIRKLPKYGQGCAEVDTITQKVAEYVFRRIGKRSAWRGGRFMASCLMFETYVPRGKIVGATPDGRLAREPLGDSFGAYQGRDLKGPTALLNSVTSFSHAEAPGTLVVNIRFSKTMFDDVRSRRKLQKLVQTYFARGGMQIQINVVDQAVLKDAMVHPERHENLVVRLGGYSAYFTHLSDETKATILERTVHEQ